MPVCMTTKRVNEIVSSVRGGLAVSIVVTREEQGDVSYGLTPCCVVLIVSEKFKRNS